MRAIRLIATTVVITLSVGCESRPSIARRSTVLAEQMQGEAPCARDVVNVSGYARFVRVTVDGVPFFEAQVFPVPNDQAELHQWPEAHSAGYFILHDLDLIRRSEGLPTHEGRGIEVIDRLAGSDITKVPGLPFEVVDEPSGASFASRARRAQMQSIGGVRFRPGAAVVLRVIGSPGTDTQAPLWMVNLSGDFVVENEAAKQ